MAARSRTTELKSDRMIVPPPRTDVSSKKREMFVLPGLGPSWRWLLGTVAALTAATLILNGDGLTLEGDNILVALIWSFLAALLLFVRWYRNTPFWLDECDDKSKARTALQWFDVTAAVFFGWVFVSFAVVWCSGNGAPRAMLTMLAHWGGFAAMFTTWRLLLNDQCVIRGMLLLFVAAVIGESSAAYYHYYYVAPKTRQEYLDAQKTSVTKPNEQLTGEQQLFKNRVESPEPLGTYSLTNSLAGVLAPWCVFLCGVILLGTSHSPFHRQRMQVAIAVLMVVFVGFILLMTNSRSGILAALFGMICLVGSMIATKVRNKRTLFGILIGVFLVMMTGLGIGFATGGLTGTGLTEAMKSFGYRIQYWQSSLQMIVEHPLFGCGIGNFREYYTLYKLPMASETIADPHNLFFEVATNAGLPALVCFVVLVVAAMGCALAPKLENAKLVQNENVQPNHSKMMQACRQSYLPFFIGGVAGIIAAFIYSLTNIAPMSFDMACFVLAGFVAGFFLFAPIMDSVIVPLKGLVPICLVVLTVNLLAAGGIAFPHVNVTFWFFLALCFNQASGFRLQNSDVSVKLKPEAFAALCIAVCFLTLGMVLYPTAWLANLQANTLLRNMEANPAQYVFLNRQITEWEKVVKHDPYRTQVWYDLCAAYLLEQREMPNLTEKRPDTSDWKNLLENQMHKAGFSRDLGQVELNGTTADALAGAIRSSPLSASNFQRLGILFLDDFNKTRNRGSLDLAIALFNLSAKRYPNHALSYTWLADCYSKSVEMELQYENARLAVELDDVMPHADQKLSQELRQKMEQLCKN